MPRSPSALQGEEGQVCYQETGVPLLFSRRFPGVQEITGILSVPSLCTHLGSSLPSPADGAPLSKQYGQWTPPCLWGRKPPEPAGFSRSDASQSQHRTLPLSFLVKAQGAQDPRSLVGSFSQPGHLQSYLFWRGCFPLVQSCPHPQGETCLYPGVAPFPFYPPSISWSLGRTWLRSTGPAPFAPFESLCVFPL